MYTSILSACKSKSCNEFAELSRQSHDFSELAVEDQYSSCNQSTIVSAFKLPSCGMLPPPLKFQRRSVRAAGTDFSALNRTQQLEDLESIIIHDEILSFSQHASAMEKIDYELLMTNFN